MKLPAEMHLLLLLLLLLPPPPCRACQTSSFTECQDAPFVPVHDLAGEEFNVVTMRTSGASVVDLKDFMVGGVQANCTVCPNRLLNQTEKLPAAVRDWKVQVGLHIQGLLGSKSTLTRFVVSRSKTDTSSLISQCPASVLQVTGDPVLISIRPGVARMSVTGVRAEGRWGDDVTRTDGPLRLKVWDQDHIWDHEQLGSGSVVPTTGRNVETKLQPAHSAPCRSG